MKAHGMQAVVTVKVNQVLRLLVVHSAVTLSPTHTD